MPLGALYKAGKKMKEAYGDSMPAKGPDPEIPVPGRQRNAKKLGPMSNKEAVNRAADVLKVPGRDVVRKGMARRKKMLDEI
jgi:hypothetical protein